MQINHPLMTGLLVETIYILGHEILNIGLRFQLAQRQMSRIGRRSRRWAIPCNCAPSTFSYSSITRRTHRAGSVDWKSMHQSHHDRSVCQSSG